MESDIIPRVVIIGGGFAGVNSALQLRKFGNKIRFTLISDRSWHDYKARIFKIVETGNISSVYIPLSSILDSEHVVVDPIQSVNLEKRLVTGASGTEYPYDYLVIASGSSVNFHGVLIIKDTTFTINSSLEALRLREHIKDTIKSMITASDEEKNSLGHFVIVGGGGTGVEMTAAVSRSARKYADEFGVDPSFITVDLFHAGSRLLGKLKPTISAKVERRLRWLGVNIFYHRRLMKEHLENISIGELHIKADTIIWAAGVKPNRIFPYDEEDITNYLTLKNHPEVYIIGDAGRDEYYGMAQTALEHAKYVSKSIMRQIKGDEVHKYMPSPVYYAVPVSSWWAALQTRHLTVTGWLGWIVRRYVDLRYLVMRLPLGLALSIFMGSRHVKQDEYDSLMEEKHVVE